MSYFLRYLVILRYGGVYADIDVKCQKPLEALIRPTDTMVVGWEVEAPTDEAALAMGLVRRRQVHQMFFAAAPGHPALREVCNDIAAGMAPAFNHNETRTGTLERYGQGIWTDAVLKHALMQQQAGKVRISCVILFLILLSQ